MFKNKALGVAALSWALIFAGALSIGAGCGRVRSSDSREAAVAEKWIHGVGYIEPVGEVRRLAFKHAGVVASCPVELGQPAAAGSVVMTLRDAEERAAVVEAEAAVALACAQFEQVRAGINSRQIQAVRAAKAAAEAGADYAQQAFARQKQLMAANASSRDQFDLAQAEWRRQQAIVAQQEAELGYVENYVRETDLAVARARVHAAEARLAAARERVAETQLRAPCDGVVLELLRREGEATRGGDGEPVLIFADPTRLRVRAEIDETQALALSAGARAIVSGPALGGAEFVGRVTFVKAVMGKKTVFAQTATERKDLDARQVFIELPPETRLPLGLEVDVRIESGERLTAVATILQRAK
jgi:HlyD family secretion protein